MGENVISGVLWMRLLTVKGYGLRADNVWGRNVMGDTV